MLNERDNALQSSFLRLFLGHQKSIYAFILAMVHDYADAEDILQETSIVMWQKFREYQPGTDFIAWGLTIARFQVLKYFKYKSRSKVQFNDALLEAISHSMASELTHIDSRLEALRNCRRKLTKQDRALLEKRYEHGIAFSQIARDTGKTVHAIYKKVSRIQDALLKCIDKTLRSELLPE